MNSGFKFEWSIFKVDAICIQMGNQRLDECDRLASMLQGNFAKKAMLARGTPPMLCEGQCSQCGLIRGWYVVEDDIKYIERGVLMRNLHFCQWCNIMSTFKYLIAHWKWLWWLSIWSSMTYRNRIVCSITIHGPCKKLILPSSGNLHTTNNIGGEFTKHGNVLDDLIGNTGICAYIYMYFSFRVGPFTRTVVCAQQGKCVWMRWVQRWIWDMKHTSHALRTPWEHQWWLSTQDVKYLLKKEILGNVWGKCIEDGV